MQASAENQASPEGLEREGQEEDKALLSSYKVKLDVFEGPFDLLLAMVDKGEVDLYKVSLTQITSGFLDYIKTMEKLNIVIAGEFLLMAAYLLEMKSKMLLPEVPAAEDEAEHQDDDDETCQAVERRPEEERPKKQCVKHEASRARSRRYRMAGRDF